MSDKKPARVFHTDLWGARQAKYDWLDKHDRAHTDWKELNPKTPFHLFIPLDETLDVAYRRFASIPAIFPVNSVGIVTARDALTIHWSREETWKTVTVFSRMEPELAREGFKLGKDVQDWKVPLAQKDLLDSGPNKDMVVPVLYRPFDVRYTYYTGQSCGFICRPRPEVMRHMLAGENVALVTPKQHKDEFGALATESIGAHKAVAAYDINYYFPLYLYPSADKADLFARHDDAERVANLNAAVVSALARAHGRAPSPEEIFHYIYAVLYAPAYRAKYAEFLRIDFPRVPLTADAALFAKLADLGGRLTELHLLRSADLDPPACRFEGQGDGRVGRGRTEGVRYEPATQRVYVNAAQYFAPVAEDVWAYRVGGYQVCEKWLKDRTDRRLALDDVRTYCRIVTALKRTIALQEQIDALYPTAEADTV